MELAIQWAWHALVGHLVGCLRRVDPGSCSELRGKRDALGDSRRRGWDSDSHGAVNERARDTCGVPSPETLRGWRRGRHCDEKKHSERDERLPGQTDRAERAPEGP